jgi:hypothetical protein
MNLSTNEPEKQNPLPGLTHGCPFLGLRLDPETHFSSSSPGNYCHKVNPSEPIQVSYQETFCLGGKYAQCIIFKPDWTGILPDTIRGDGSPGSKSSGNKKKNLPAAVALGKVISSDNSIPSDVSLENPSNGINNFQDNYDMKEKKQDDGDGNVVPWAKLYGEASQRYQNSVENSSKRNDKLIWIILLLIATVIFSVSIWGVLDRITKLRTTTELSVLSARTLSAITASYETAVANEITATANAIFLSGNALTEMTPTPQETAPEVSELPTEPVVILEPTSTIVSCDDFTGYQIEIVSGPNLTPRPGYVYQEGFPEPTVMASWNIRNPGSCKWEQIVLQDTTTGENFVPLLFMGDEKIDLSNLEQGINPGEEFLLTINFKLKDVKSVNRDWIMILNGFPLLEQPHIVLKVENWINIIQAQITPTKSSGSSSGKPSPTPKPDRVTDEPPTRAVSTPPTRVP